MLESYVLMNTEAFYLRVGQQMSTNVAQSPSKDVVLRDQTPVSPATRLLPVPRLWERNSAPGTHIILLFCAVALFTAAASASLLGPAGSFLPLARDSGGSHVPLASTTQAATPQQSQKLPKYVAKLRPTKINKKVVGDKGARGKFVMKNIRSGTDTYTQIFAIYRNLKSEGASPLDIQGGSCLVTTGSPILPDYVRPYTNLTTRSSRPGRYSFGYKLTIGPLPASDLNYIIAQVLSKGGYTRVQHGEKQVGLCGKLKKKA
ncbi:unnamed protein product [Closterium sp. Yama58-4]|nr:unnamed protein product [Closterium sp. Yama58-4]